MQTDMITPDDIRYNPAEQQFEARVTLHGASGTRTYACAVPADLSMPLEQAAAALRDAAIARHTAAPGLYSAQQTLTPVTLRAPTRPSWRKSLLNALPNLRALRAA